MLIQADARHIPLMDKTVQTVVTSPPYFGLRDYGVSGQIGLESTPDAYVAEIVHVFREVRRVLKDDGTVWLNLGDSYAGSGPSGASYQSETTKRRAELTHDGAFAVSKTLGARGLTYAEKKPIPPAGLKSKDLIGIPWRVAFALQADGWYLRSDIIWHKPNPMPESVTDRPTKSHEYLFLLAKSERYYYDAAAVAEEAQCDRMRGPALHPDVVSTNGNAGLARRAFTGRRNNRSVWTVPTMPYSGAHFATMPEKLVEPCILAGCPPGGLVFDPFIGSGTVGAVARRLDRKWVGTDLNQEYIALANKRAFPPQQRFSFL
jgi:DNA modification methylase